ncbi:hypothetical protein AALP_AA8G000900 [Arabis alpina]|uniref:MD-2-related lipid-recognition domain-containing protein n=1 Tax=Arabis alpina TaxID=50452 RepID=A0A087G403_ARAAL|nr:hypothetical protein AALP_AA8G000900 [Arabis alpina]
MAISHVETLLLLLLPSFFFLSAYCGLPFRPCVTGEGDFTSTRLRDSSIDATSGDMIPEIETREGSYARAFPIFTVNSVGIKVRGSGPFALITGFTVNVTSTQPLAGTNPWVYVHAKIYLSGQLIYNDHYYICGVTTCRGTPGVYVIGFYQIIERLAGLNYNIRVHIKDFMNVDKCITFDTIPGSSLSSL